MNKPVITIDVEDWIQSTWDRSLPVTKLAVDNTFRLLDLLDNLSVRSTMFVQGQIAQSYPQVVKEICRRKHELACHGYGHVEIFKLSKEQFKQDVYKSKQLLEDISGCEISGFRAPDFSVIKSTLWALEIIAEAGFTYDSSICPYKTSRYGIKGWNNKISKLLLPNGYSIIEIPIGTFNFIGKNYPAGGGGYSRLFPGIISRMLIKKTLKINDYVFYCHPYEFSKNEFSKLKYKIPLRVKLHQGIGRSHFESRFKKMINNFGGKNVYDMLSTINMQEIETIQI